MTFVPKGLLTAIRGSGILNCYIGEGLPAETLGAFFFCALLLGV